MDQPTPVWLAFHPPTNCQVYLHLDRMTPSQSSSLSLVLALPPTHTSSHTTSCVSSPVNVIASRSGPFRPTAHDLKLAQMGASNEVNVNSEDPVEKNPKVKVDNLLNENSLLMEVTWSWGKIVKSKRFGFASSILGYTAVCDAFVCVSVCGRCAGRRIWVGCGVTIQLLKKPRVPSVIGRRRLLLEGTFTIPVLGHVFYLSLSISPFLCSEVSVLTEAKFFILFIVPQERQQKKNQGSKFLILKRHWK